jgi:hypothetical protein
LSLTVSCELPVVSFLTTTEAPGITPPPVSLTVPEIDAVDWANEGVL